MQGLTGAFSSLGINESSNTCRTSTSSKPPQNRTRTSLPDLSSPENFTVSLPILRTFSISNYEFGNNLGAEEQPIDFARKYPENQENKTSKPGNRNCTYNKVVKSYNKSFSMYAETDLDQPTDYSLRYAEDDSDSDDCSPIPKSEATEFVQDTIKTYCTEDTPYETPCNFSTATSMSDLRIDDKPSIDNKLENETKIVAVVPEEIPVVVPTKIVKSEFSSGLMTPEKPVNYCEEGTPGYFSRVASLSSLNSIPVSDAPKAEAKEVVEIKEKEKRVEAKAVKFEEVVNYAEETPLMFSRSSSLESLNSIEQHSIHDDRSSVVSDFSRLTSGLVSPSELPDSPTQTVPPSPKSRKNPIRFPSISKAKTDDLPPLAPPKGSVFEDVVQKFKMETTPIQFSSATSLSSLTIDDHDESDGKPTREPGVLEEGSGAEINNNISENLCGLNVHNDSCSEDEDDDILADCINIGIQKNKYSQSKLCDKASGSFSEMAELSPCNSRLTPQNSPQILEPANVLTSRPSPNARCNVRPKIDVTSDSLMTYYTEDTPAILSHAGSNSDLSVLSIPTESKIVKDYLSEVSSDSDDDDSRLLDECIKSGILKTSRSNETNQIPLSDLKGATSSREDLTEGPSGAQEQKIDLNISLESNASVNDQISLESNASVDGHSRRSSLSAISDGSYKSENALLQECILAGMPKKPLNGFKEESNDLTEAEQALLKQCILEGMQKSSLGTRSPVNNSNDLTEAEQALLKQCILTGMRNNSNNLNRSPRNASTSRDSTELSDADQALLEQCILAGMPKNRQSSSKTNQIPGRYVNKPVMRKPREPERVSQAAEHTCCIHCPRNQAQQALARQTNHLRIRKKSRGHEKMQVHVRETQDVNILYVTSQILAWKKEVVDRSHEEWV